MASLVEVWHEIIQQKQATYQSKKPKLLHKNPALPTDFIQRNAEADTHIVVDDEALFVALSRQFAWLGVHYSSTVFQDFDLQAVLRQALARRVALPSGGFLVVDEVEAMTVIDVNAGSALGKQSLLQINLEAAQAIAHTLRLRNIGGIIVIDFIDVSKQAQNRIKNALKDALKNDEMQTTVYEFGALGLLQMTRERIRLSLAKSIAQSEPMHNVQNFFQKPLDTPTPTPIIRTHKTQT